MLKLNIFGNSKQIYPQSKKITRTSNKGPSKLEFSRSTFAESLTERELHPACDLLYVEHIWGKFFNVQRNTCITDDKKIKGITRGVYLSPQSK